MVEPSLNVKEEIAELERALAEKKAALEQQKLTGTIEELPHAKEILREVVKEKIAATPGLALPVPPSPQPPAPQPAYPLSYNLEELKPKVQELVRIAFDKSISEAIQLAKVTESAALIDAFHDILVDELYTHLVETGKLEIVK